MKVVLDIKDSKAEYILDLLKQYTYVKIKPMKRSKAAFLKNLEHSIEEVKLAQAGKIKLQSLEDFLNEI